MVTPDRLALFEAAKDDTVKSILRLNKRVVIIATIPQWGGDPVPCLLKEVALPRRGCEDSQRRLSRAPSDATAAPSLAALRRVAAANPAMKLIEPAKSLCDEQTCTSIIAGTPIYADGIHFRRNPTPDLNRELARRAGLDAVFD